MSLTSRGEQMLRKRQIIWVKGLGLGELGVFSDELDRNRFRARGDQILIKV